MANTFPNIAPFVDLTARTFDTLRARGLALLQQRITDFAYNDVIATGVVPAVVDVLAWFQEQNAFYFDRKHRNSLLELADTPEAMLVLARAQGYNMASATSASVPIVCTPTPPQPVPITLEEGTQVVAAGLIFEVAANFVIPAGKPVWPDNSTTEVFSLVQGATTTETFTSDGSQFQLFQLGQTNIIDGSLKVVVQNETWDEVESLVFVEGTQQGRDSFQGEGIDNQQVTLSLLYAIIDPNDQDAIVLLITPPGGTAAQAVAWKQVQEFTGAPQEFRAAQAIDGTTTLTFGLGANQSAPAIGSTIDVLYLIAGSQKRYQLILDADFGGTVQFGDGVFGVIPPAGAVISISYRTGGGVAGNVPIGTINTTIQGLLPNGTQTPVLIVNEEPGRGGEPPESVDHARFFAPQFAKANVRAVTQADWTALAATYRDPLYGAPSYASAYLKQNVPELNTVVVAVWGRDQHGQVSTANSALKAGMQNFLNSRRTITTAIEMVDGEVIIIDMDVTITLDQGQSSSTVFPAITAAVQQFFQSSAVVPGINLSISQLYDVIQSVPGVSRAVITSIVGSQAISAVVSPANGDGTTNLFQGQFALAEGTSIVPGSVVLTDGTQQVVDTGEGAFTGNILPGLTPGATGNAVSYSTGTFSVSFASPPVPGAEVTATAKATVFFAHEEDLGASDGAFAVLDGATQYYPIVGRAPRGLWSGDQHLIIDSFQVGTTAEMRGNLPRGITPSSFTAADSSGSPQVVVDDGAGNIRQTNTFGPIVGSISYADGVVDFFFTTPPTLTVKATWTTVTVDLTMPADLLPLTPGRVFMWGGFDDDAAQTGGVLLAYDDGAGNISGNVLPGGTIDYTSGEIFFTWNTTPPPGPGGGSAFTVTLTETPDGVRTTFHYTTGVNLQPPGGGGLGGIGRTRFQLSSLSKQGFTLEDAYDNWQGILSSPSLQRIGVNTVDYPTGAGVLTFAQPPPAGTPTTFPGRVTNVATFLYAGFVFFVKTPGGPGLDKGLFADNNGRFWGPPAAGPADSFPTDRLDAIRGVYFARLAGSPVAAGRELQLTYDALTGVPPALDIVVAGNEVAAAGTITLTENPQGSMPNTGP